MSLKTWFKANWRLVILILIPLLFMPIPIVLKTSEAKCAYVLIIVASYWMSDVLPLAVTSLLPVVLLPLFGILRAKDASKTYFKDSTMMFMGAIMVALAVEKCNLHRRIALKILLIVGERKPNLIFGFMLATWLLSMWISNTATTAMMLPVAEAVLSQLSGFADEDYSNFGKSLAICIAYAANCGGTATLTGTGSNMVMKGFVDDLYEKHNVTTALTYTNYLGWGLPIASMILILTWLWLSILFLGFREFFSCCRRKKTDLERRDHGIQDMIKEEYTKLGNMKYQEIVVIVIFTTLVLLWFFREPQFMTGWSAAFRPGYVTGAVPSILLSTLMFIIPTTRPFSKSADDRDYILTWPFVQNRMPWGIVLLFGGGFTMAEACSKSGLSSLIGEKLATFDRLPSAVMVGLICLLVAMLTEVTSNSATTTLLMPIMASMAENMKKNPLYLMLPVTTSTSFAYMLPVATPPNAIVFSTGRLKVVDMIKAGWILNIFGVLIVTLGTHTWGMAIFKFNQLPWQINNSTRTL
ncbi:DgyrCDS11253 [Dimorphilus gyrociliatus]|uniref:DgyrCDS11253 n=1 Tax=Dimorphilus gyrociliatus TaxID=2664684 RepID=A0A7I8W2W9_9ANNE|nr:DgyrCDS11253 [Dimorphilus gyrociliatus]